MVSQACTNLKQLFIVILPMRLIFVYIRLLWGKPGNLQKPLVHEISSVRGNLFIFGLVSYFCPDSQKINILTAQYERISDDQGVCEFFVLLFLRYKFTASKRGSIQYYTIQSKRSSFSTSIRLATNLIILCNLFANVSTSVAHLVRT